MSPSCSHKRQYSFTYEATPSTPSAGACTPLSGTYQTNCVTARLASVTLPTGGTISYTYYNNGGNFPVCTTGNNGIFTDGSSSCLQVTTPDTTSGTKWIYTRTLVSGSQYKTVATDPIGNDKVIQFQGIYETQRQTYQGSSTSGQLLQTINTCYNGAASPCTGTAIAFPITRRTQLIAYPDNTGKVCKHDQFFDTYGLQTEQDDYDYGNGAPAATVMRKVIPVYNHSLTNGIVSMPSSITICNGTGTSTACTGPSGSSTGTVVGQTTFAYDETPVVAPTGTSPQHVSITGSRGNATTIKNLIQGNTFLTKTASYYDTGNPQTVTDVNTAAMTFNYPDATSTCGNAFPTSITEPLSMSKSMAYNCIGAVQTSLTDENGKITTTGYTDSFFWRPASITDPANAITNFSYATSSSPYTWSEATLTVVTGNSVVDKLTTVDGLGRTHLQQTKQGPASSNYDTVETDYDGLGRVSRVTLPYNGTSGQTNPSAPATTTTYDALSRPLTITDAGNGTVSYTYILNDTYISVGPAPNGENTKRRQLEYNAIDELTSVCEVTSASQSGACGQSNAATGYLTTYVNNVLGNLTAVTQNAQPGGTPQTRSYAFDGLSRITSETNPENGTTTYTYDSASGCTGTYNGDMVKKIDAAGNVTCSAYDTLHRVTTINYPSGPNSSSTAMKVFYYDTSHFNTTYNTNGRLASAGTCQNPTCAGPWITAEDFSYSARGELTDLYEWTTNSGGWYHITQSYWPHGAPNQVSGLTGLPTITYGGTISSTVGLDGEGRITQVTASSGQNPVTGVTYNNSSLPGQVNFGSGDSDIFAYDSNTMRMTQFKFNVGTQLQSLTGTLTWNANSTLSQLAITDQFNSANTQTCKYGDPFATPPLLVMTIWPGSSVRTAAQRPPKLSPTTRLATLANRAALTSSSPPTMPPRIASPPFPARLPRTTPMET